MEFNEKLQELRKNKNLTQEQLAEMLFVSRTAISKWESGIYLTYGDWKINIRCALVYGYYWWCVAEYKFSNVL